MMHEGWMPHGACLNWETDVLGLRLISDMVIALVYFAIPFVLASLARNTKAKPVRTHLWLFVAFILACGCTHIMDIITLFEPLYWQDAYVRAFTAIASGAALGALIHGKSIVLGWLDR